MSPRLKARGWINGTPQWSSPTHLALRSANPSFSPAWTKASKTLSASCFYAQHSGAVVTGDDLDKSISTTLKIKANKKQLHKLRHVISHPVQPPYLREVIFDCSAIKTLQDVDNLKHCRPLLVEILELLYDQTEDAVHPIRDALIILLEAFLCALDTKQQV
ncbi:unnamed protein product [Aureobasidium vineae]|uniref:Uncharacterized protein n=1 Tax=Aureobasidium vineae TaxID=2773715 RepID=A0A9N8P8T5_9PEZI|nr:unnamed protein product [Aureobasidium vineae]